ncbi:MAG: hypothetical protein J7M40_11780 [Planctomycetes bacterium]|nr:hypothetical protein [Planctomycetota bacterium]
MKGMLSLVLTTTYGEMTSLALFLHLLCLLLDSGPGVAQGYCSVKDQLILFFRVAISLIAREPGRDWVEIL